MSFEFNFDGFDDIINDLENTCQKLDNCEGNIPLDKLLNSSFMSAHSEYSDFFEMLSSAGIELESQEDFDNLDDSILDSIISEKTDFSSWQDMTSCALEEYLF